MMATLSIEINSPVAEAKDFKDHASLINALIPDLIKRRTGRLPSLRQTFTGATDPQQTQPPQSPPPPYAEPQSVEVDNTSDAESVSGHSSHPLAAPARHDSIYLVASETSTSDIRWKHVGEGCRLVECAGWEAMSETEDPDLARKMYIDGVGYLLNALPDLSPQENAQLANYLPASFRQTDNQRSHQDARFQDGGEEGDRKNYIYQFMTVATMYGVLFASLVLPLLERIIAAVYRWDQRCQISTRVADTTTQAVSTVARRAFTSLNEGKTGQIALGMTLYTIDGASRGFLEGYAQALKRQNIAERRADMSNAGFVED